MKVIVNRIIPFPGYVAINLFGIVFARKEYWEKRPEQYKWRTLNHEAIHTAQMKELLYIGFYILYLFEWIYRLIRDYRTAYRSISFEREAYENQSNYNYLTERRHFAQWRKR